MVFDFHPSWSFETCLKRRLDDEETNLWIRLFTPSNFLWWTIVCLVNHWVAVTSANAASASCKRQSSKSLTCTDRRPPIIWRLRTLAFATFLVWRLPIGACGVNACGFWCYGFWRIPQPFVQKFLGSRFIFFRTRPCFRGERGSPFLVQEVLLRSAECHILRSRLQPSKRERSPCERKLTDFFRYLNRFIIIIIILVIIEKRVLSALSIAYLKPIIAFEKS